LQALFLTLRKLVGSSQKIIGVVGSDGGGRDKQKRYTMGEISGNFSDYVIITDVNCFDEDPLEIARMLKEGALRARKQEGEDLFVVIDRRAAIAKACSLAKRGDVVAITAKGTEPCMVVANGKKIMWDDRGVARAVLRELLNIKI
jgi:UDP-N-acetylmuramoyl-L-alanyl-D-glutamate--2,6-diaminopimelate ligase